MIQPKDKSYLEMAYGLAEKARGWASPNPYVGAVIVRGGGIVGWGYHERPGAPHAEINALRLAGPRARGSTLYLTLEPCVHWGRTRPASTPSSKRRRAAWSFRPTTRTRSSSGEERSV